jgi:hypothetical protein
MLFAIGLVENRGGHREGDGERYQNKPMGQERVLALQRGGNHVGKFSSQRPQKPRKGLASAFKNEAK